MAEFEVCYLWVDLCTLFTQAELPGSLQIRSGTVAAIHLAAGTVPGSPGLVEAMSSENLSLSDLAL